MTLEELLECSADKLKALSKEELLAYFEPYLKVTRPELADKPATKNTSTGRVLSAGSSSKRDAAKAIAAQLGIELDL